MAEQVTTTNPASGAPVTQVAPAAPMPGGLNPEHIAPDIGQVADGVAINGGLGNALTVDLGDGYLQIDTGPSLEMAETMMKALDPAKPVKVIAFSHGHLGYNFACQAWIARAKQLGQPAPTIIAQDHAAQLIRQYETTQPMMGLLLALRRFDPLYWLLARLPGFNLFRVPARWLLLYAFGMALLPGEGMFQLVEISVGVSA